MSRPVGVDISKWQANNLQTHPQEHGVDFTLLHNKSDFIILRAGYGGSAGGAHLDERVYQYMNDLAPILENEPKPFTFYWYFRDDVSLIDQANLFSLVINRYKNVVNLTPIVDAEVFVKSDLVSTQKIIEFQAEVERQTGLLVDTLYARAGQLNAETTPGLPAVLPNLHVARYDPDLDEQTDEPWEEGPPEEYVEPRDYDDWVYWQFDASGHGAEYGVVSASIDRNVFNGTLEELRELANLHEPAAPPPIFDSSVMVEKKVVNVVYGDKGVVEVSFRPDPKNKRPHAFQFVFPKGLLKEARAFARVGEGENHILFGRYSVEYRDWIYAEFPDWVMVNEDMYITFKFFPTGDLAGAVNVEFVYEELDY